MRPKDFAMWEQKTILGASLQIVAPTGQYYPGHLINPGSNRWAFKPELGLSHRWGNWILDTYGGVWLFTANSNYLTCSEFSKRQNTLTEAPVGSLEMHLSYDVKPRLWASVDGNYWYGGETTVNNVVKIGTLQSNSRIGGTVSVPLTKHQSDQIELQRWRTCQGWIVSVAQLSVEIGGTFRTVSLAWQYSWIGSPK